MSGVENAGAFLVALAVVKLSELAIRKIAAAKSGNGNNLSHLAELMRASADSESKANVELKQIADNTRRQLDSMLDIAKELNSLRMGLHMLTKDMATLQKSQERLHERFDKITDQRGYGGGG